jgi:hypothetical protein
MKTIENLAKLCERTVQRYVKIVSVTEPPKVLGPPIVVLVLSATPLVLLSLKLEHNIMSISISYDCYT